MKVLLKKNSTNVLLKWMHLFFGNHGIKLILTPLEKEKTGLYSRVN
jgi:hypothetical protein